jgi:epoxyqueuosine reductase
LVFSDLKQSKKPLNRKLLGMNGESNSTPRAAMVQRMAGDLGFALVGIAPAQPSEHSDFVKQWLASGSHGQMSYLAENLAVRMDPRQLLPGAQSVICVADLYSDQSGDDGSESSSSADDGDMIAKPTEGSPVGRIARYAWGDDYHKVIKKRLFKLADALKTRYPEFEYRCAVDTAPLLEREHAQRAGLGWTGKHTLLIHPELGSWLLLGQIVTTLRIATSAETGYQAPTVVPDDHCGTCTQCIDACPTECISPYQLDAQRCISYLTIEHRGLIDPQLHPAMGDWIAGCDICQEVCPFNNQLARSQEGDAQGQGDTGDMKWPPTIEAPYQPRPPAPGIELLEILNWDAQSRQKAFIKSSLKRIKLDMLKRNALIAAGNFLAGQVDAPLKERVEQLAQDLNEPELVRQTAKQVIEHLAVAGSNQDHPTS